MNQNIYNQVIKNEPCQNQNNPNYASISQKKRLLAKVQSECMLNVPTKQEPADYNYLQHCGSACKESGQVNIIAINYYYCVDFLNVNKQCVTLF